jgi:putative FmdB family regulatory protein
VAIYEYRCDDHGVFEVIRPIGETGPTLGCPACGGDARRVFSKPMLSSSPPALVAAIDHAEKSRHEPEVVTSWPRTGARKRTPVLPLTPTLRRLPRP